jgi:hypothetical protein
MRKKRRMKKMLRGNMIKRRVGQWRVSGPAAAAPLRD